MWEACFGFKLRLEDANDDDSQGEELLEDHLCRRSRGLMAVAAVQRMLEQQKQSSVRLHPGFAVQ